MFYLYLLLLEIAHDRLLLLQICMYKSFRLAPSEVGKKPRGKSSDAGRGTRSHNDVGASPPVEKL